jgi:hypothetical protein
MSPTALNEIVQKNGFYAWHEVSAKTGAGIAEAVEALANRMIAHCPEQVFSLASLQCTPLLTAMAKAETEDRNVTVLRDDEPTKTRTCPC